MAFTSSLGTTFATLGAGMILGGEIGGSPSPPAFIPQAPLLTGNSTPVAAPDKPFTIPTSIKRVDGDVPRRK